MSSQIFEERLRGAPYIRKESCVPTPCPGDFFQAARALGVSLVAYGPPGHWLEAESQGSQFLEAFIPLDLTGNAGLPSRIVNAVKDYPEPIDGITTVTEFLLVAVAQAAEQLNLSTSPSQVYSKSVNKYQCRLEDGSNSCLLVRSTAELHDLVATNEGSVPVPGPPWIVKPCNGWHILNVVKASNYEALLEAVQKVSSHAAYTRAAPARMIRAGKRVLFFEVIDNFPCSGDAGDGSGNFKETQLLFPSALPRAEQNALRDSLLQSILRLGFSSGVLHVEARVRHSNHEYRETDGQTMDLHPRPNPPASDPGIFLIEINARPPGYVDTCSSAFANGVDLFAPQTPIALGDEERVHALSQPFQVPPHVAIAAIQAERSGTVVSDDPWGDLRERDPALMDHVVQHVMNFEKGEHVEDPSLDTTPWLSAFMAYSTASRADLLKLCADVKARFVCRIE
ncbi:hypothetical protein IFM58399_10393 [Aspergillus lentulus]|uniref:uncharacterized protein n=1 Tax=Aspergillus lentulus TaxID=293939 RepID=UPI0013959AEC|nr:uncharacterized protein IFM58399_10393 [Aspergillus lentulus]GFF56760.1 hypothetical protein IFM58399_10393 [Aspergillus lentulus]